MGSYGAQHNTAIPIVIREASGEDFFNYRLCLPIHHLPMLNGDPNSSFVTANATTSSTCDCITTERWGSLQVFSSIVKSPSKCRPYVLQDSPPSSMCDTLNHFELEVTISAVTFILIDDTNDGILEL